MKIIPPILSLTFPPLTLINCSLLAEQIASRINPSIVKIANPSKYVRSSKKIKFGENTQC